MREFTDIGESSRIYPVRVEKSRRRGTIRVADFFAGIGGMRMGFEQAAKRRGVKKRVEVVYSNDFDEKCAVTYNHRFGATAMDVGDIQDIEPLDIPDFDLLLGGFPCQAFSIAGRKHGFEDPRGRVFFNLAAIIHEKFPKAILLENVASLTTQNRGETFAVIRSKLEEIGYHIHFAVLNSRYFGVPQNRPRVYIAGFKKKTAFEFPVEGEETKCIGDILVENPEESVYVSQKYYEGMKRHRERHKSKGNGFGYVVLKRKDVANALVLGGMGRERNLVEDTPIKVYRKGDDKLVKKNRHGLRRLTVREWARCQGFPDSFEFPVAKIHAYRQIANSVSVPVIERIARRMLRVL